MVEIICTCVEEALELTEDVIYAVIINITKAKEQVVAHRLCVNVLKRCQDLLSTPINNYVYSIFTQKTDITDELSEEAYSLV